MVHVPLMFQNGVNFLRRLALRGGGLMTARVSVLKSHTSPDMPPFSLCNKKRLAVWHMNRSLFPTTLSIPFYNIGKQVGLRTYQHPLVITWEFMRCTQLGSGKFVRLRKRPIMKVDGRRDSLNCGANWNEKSACPPPPFWGGERWCVIVLCSVTWCVQHDLP